MIGYHSISSKDMSRLHRFGKKVLPGVFLGYVLYAGWIWKGDIFVSAMEELEKDGRIRNPRLETPCKRSDNSEKWWNFELPDCRWKSKTIWRRTGSENPERGEELEDLRIESDGSPPPQDSLLGDGEARNDFWSISGNYIYRQHVEPRVKLYVLAEESFTILLRYIDVTRATNTTLDVLLERRIDDYWNTEGDRDLSDAWTGFTRFTMLNEKPPDGSTWSGARLTKKANNIQVRSFVARNMGKRQTQLNEKKKAEVG